MDIDYRVVVLDAADLAAVSSFWAAVLGGSVDAEDDWHMVLDPDGTPRIGVQLAPNHVPPVWPDGEQQQQIHMDLWVTDFLAAHEEVMGLGATLLWEAPDLDAVEGWQVYADPAGHPFCLCWHRTALTQISPGRKRPPGIVDPGPDMAGPIGPPKPESDMDASLLLTLQGFRLRRRRFRPTTRAREVP